MRTRILTVAIVAGFAAAAIAVAVGGTSALAQDKPSNHKNLQIFPKDIAKKELKAKMKAMAKAVGKSCEDCHDTDDFSKDTDMKKVARKMLRMTGEINVQFKKDKVKESVNCATCHAGKEKPSK